jgi:hypothetical protein
MRRKRGRAVHGGEVKLEEVVGQLEPSQEGGVVAPSEEEGAVAPSEEGALGWIEGVPGSGRCCHRRSGVGRGGCADEGGEGSGRRDTQRGKDEWAGGRREE